VTNARNDAISGLKEGLVADLGFLALWGVVVGTSTLVAVFIGMASVKQFVNRIDSKLPRPIFCIIGNMLPVTMNEIDKSLGTNVNVIQWMSVNRNTHGGINLTGLFRDIPFLDTDGNPVGDTVRAQKYHVETDIWCNILQIYISDEIVPLTAGGPGIAPVNVLDSYYDAFDSIELQSS
jgi:hypothetical protein